MKLEEIYKSVLENIAKLDLEELWPAFHAMNFALYNDDYVILNSVLIARTSEFLANTTIYYQGRYIAIYHVDESSDVDIITSLVVHEMFHAFQMENRESRFPNEVTAVLNYHYSEELISLKWEENKLLVKLNRCFHQKDFDKLLALKKYEMIHFPYEYDYSAKVEIIEGTAQYIELQVLSKLSKSKYEQRIKVIDERLEDISTTLPIRTICYDSGAYIIKICRENSIDICYSFIAMGYLEELVSRTEPLCVEVSDKARMLLDNTTKSLRIHMNKIQTEYTEKLHNVELIAFNIWGAQNYNGYVFTNFLQYRDEDEKTVYGDIMFTLENNMIKEAFMIGK